MLTLIIINFRFQVQKHEHNIGYTNVTGVFIRELSWDVGRVESEKLASSDVVARNASWIVLLFPEASDGFLSIMG